MAVVKLNVSFESAVADKLRRRAAELKKPASRYLADLIEEEERRSRDELAAEGYRLLAADTAAFATAAVPVAAESWPGWEESPLPPNKRKAHKKKGHA